MSESFFEPYLFNEPFDPIHRTAMNESQMGPFGFSSSTNWLINPFTEVTSLLDGYIVNEYQLTFWTVYYMSQLCVFRALRLKHLYKCMSYLYDAVLSFLKFESFPVLFFYRYIISNFPIGVPLKKERHVLKKSEYSFS